MTARHHPEARAILDRLDDRGLLLSEKLEELASATAEALDGLHEVPLADDKRETAMRYRDRILDHVDGRQEHGTFEPARSPRWIMAKRTAWGTMALMGWIGVGAGLHEFGAGTIPVAVTAGVALVAFARLVVLLAVEALLEAGEITRKAGW